MTICAAMGRAALALIAGFALRTSAAELKPPPGPLQKAMEATKGGDFTTARKILAAEAEKGNAEAANAIGELTLAGRGAKPDPAEAVKWFQKAADAGYSAAMFNLSRLLDRGAEGVTENKEKALFLLRTSAEAGYAPAQLRLGLTTEPDPKARTDKAKYAEARGWLERAAAQEYPDALLALVRYYDEGLGDAPHDAQKATDLCFRAAKAGSVVAMNEMAVRYQKGAGAPQDNVAAIGWLTFAAQHDLPAAHVNLGACYENGIGVRQDFDQAGRHYAAAAQANFAPGEFLLGRMIEEGKGTKANPVHAYVLYTRAAAKNHPGAAERRDALKASLKPAELAEAEQMLNAKEPSSQPDAESDRAKPGKR
jgi:TPR repeat protein